MSHSCVFLVAAYRACKYSCHWQREAILVGPHNFRELLEGYDMILMRRLELGLDYGEGVSWDGLFYGKLLSMPSQRYKTQDMCVCVTADDSRLILPPDFSDSGTTFQ